VAIIVVLRKKFLFSPSVIAACAGFFAAGGFCPSPPTKDFFLRIMQITVKLVARTSKPMKIGIRIDISSFFLVSAAS